MKTKQLAFLILIAMFSCSKEDQLENSNINAQENFVELSQVKEIANEIYFETKTNSIAGKSNMVKSEKRTVEAINEVKNEKGKISYYVINYNEGGFILLSSDKRTQPILAYSKNGKFGIDEDFYPIGLKFWVKDTKKQITDLQNSNIQQSEKDKLAWELVQYAIANSSFFEKEPPIECYDHTEYYTVGPLLNTLWYQSGGFNDALPEEFCYGATINVPAGCAPIAMAQVMKYHQYPASYDWASMPLTSGTITTANFIADIHEAIGNEYFNQPSYDCDKGTGVNSENDLALVLKNQFNYSSADFVTYNYINVENNLNSNRPVILGGLDGLYGHMWVCDGYREMSYYFADCTGGTFIPMFHMNWGWKDGYLNGYFSYNNFNPGNYTYNDDKKMIYNIIP